MKYFILLFVFVACASSEKTWDVHEHPTKNNSEAIGSYSAGCLLGGKSLGYAGIGYQVMRIPRRRFFGHPKLIDFLESHAKDVHKVTGEYLLIGDMSQPMGGPMKQAHASHQTGLDVDLWFTRKKYSELKKMTLGEIDEIEAESFLKPDGTLNTIMWGEKEDKVIKLAATSPEVERIFVNAHIKKRLCDQFKGQSWLGKIRPWWFHEDHYHVRLECPQDSPDCEKQAPIPEGDDCGENLDWWFTAEAQEEWEKKKKSSKKTKIILPERCQEIHTMFDQDKS